MTHQLEQLDTLTQARGIDPLVIKDCALIELASGKRAFTLIELRDHLATINLDSIYHHFWGSILEPRFEEREFNNDLAAWARNRLIDDVLAERLAIVDPTAHADLESLRQELIDIVEDRLEENQNLGRRLATEPFEFVRAQIVIFDTHKRVRSPEELAESIPRMSVGSIFYHFIDARTRLPGRLDDFRYWLSKFDGKYDIFCQRLSDVDPYFQNLRELRQQLSIIFQDCAKEVE